MRSIDSIKSLPQPHLDENATLGDEQDATPRGTPTTHATPPTPAHHTPVHTSPLPVHTTRRPHGASAGGLAWGTVWNDAEPVIGMLRGCSLMVEHELPKLRARVRFSSPAPRLRPRSSTRALFVVSTCSGCRTPDPGQAVCPRATRTTPATLRAARLDRLRPRRRPRRSPPTASPPDAATPRCDSPGSGRPRSHLATARSSVPADRERSWYRGAGMRSCSHLHSVNAALHGGTSHCGCNRARLGRHHA